MRKAGCSQLAVLHRTSSYPAPPGSVNLRAMQTMSDAFKVPIGFSDHTMGMEVALAAVAMGACILEKHFTLDRSLPETGPQGLAESRTSSGIWYAAFASSNLRLAMAARMLCRPKRT